MNFTLNDKCVKTTKKNFISKKIEVFFGYQKLSRIFFIKKILNSILCKSIFSPYSFRIICFDIKMLICEKDFRLSNLCKTMIRHYRVIQNTAFHIFYYDYFFVAKRNSMKRIFMFKLFLSHSKK